MAIKIRPVRGQIEAPTLRGGRNLLRGTEFRGRQFAQAGQIASDFLGNILEQETKLENERINNKVTNSEVYFLGQAEEQLQQLKEQNTVYSQEQTDKIISDFGNFLDKDFANYYKNDPMAAKKGLYYKEKAKLSFMSEVNKLRGNQILAETVNRATVQKELDIKNMQMKVSKQNYEDKGIFVLLESITGKNSKFYKDNQSAISAGKSLAAYEADRQEVINEFYNSIILVRRGDGTIDYQASMDRLKKNNIGGEKIDRKQYERLESEINDNLLQELQFNQRSDELYNEKVFNNEIDNKKLDDITLDDLKRTRDKVKGIPAKNQIDAEIQNKRQKLQGVDTEPDFMKQRDIEVYIDTTNIVKDTDTPFQLEGEKEEKSLTKRYTDGEIERRFYLEQKAIIQKFAGQEEKQFQTAFKEFFASVEEQIKGGAMAVGEASAPRIYRSREALKRIARERLKQINPKTNNPYTIEDVFFNVDSDVFLQPEANKFILVPDAVLEESVRGASGGKITVPEFKRLEGETDEEYLFRRATGISGR